jgi:hypothetical protein
MKTFPLFDIKIIWFLYTLQSPPDWTKAQYLKHIFEFIFPDAIYNKYINQYDSLSYTEKKILGEYQDNSYISINEYMISNMVDIDLATWNGDTFPFKGMFRREVYSKLILEEFNKLYKKKAPTFIPSKKFTRKLNRALSEVYIDGLGLYEYNIARLNIQVKTLYNITTRNRFEHDFIVFRGEDYDSNNHPIESVISSKTKQTSISKRRSNRISNIKEYKKNDIIENKGFVSCSLNPLVAMTFSGTNTCCLYRYFIKQGTPGLLIPPYDNEYNSGITFEFECLFAPNKCKILEIHKIPVGELLGIIDNKQIYTIFDLQIIEILPLPKLR